MSKKPFGRLIPWSAAQAAENMAIDQALLESVEVDREPVLRLYGWSEPTLSLGYFQKESDRQQHPQSSSLACVRRSTGGGAILHHHELTYSIAVPLPAGDAGPRLELYVRTHRAAAIALARHGVRAFSARDLGTTASRYDGETAFLCFQRRTPEDLIVSGYKVLGSAQRKSRHAVLQHGSLLLRVSPHAPQLPGVCDLHSREITLEELADDFAASLTTELSIPWRRAKISPAEHARAGEIAAERFNRADWLLRR